MRGGIQPTTDRATFANNMQLPATLPAAQKNPSPLRNPLHTNRTLAPYPQEKSKFRLYPYQFTVQSIQPAPAWHLRVIEGSTV